VVIESAQDMNNNKSREWLPGKFMYLFPPLVSIMILRDRNRNSEEAEYWNPFSTTTDEIMRCHAGIPSGLAGTSFMKRQTTLTIISMKVIAAIDA
jgi:hypothetical protein